MPITIRNETGKTVKVKVLSTDDSGGFLWWGSSRKQLSSFDLDDGREWVEYYDRVIQFDDVICDVFDDDIVRASKAKGKVIAVTGSDGIEWKLDPKHRRLEDKTDELKTFEPTTSGLPEETMSGVELWKAGVASTMAQNIYALAKGDDAVNGSEDAKKDEAAKDTLKRQLKYVVGREAAGRLEIIMTRLETHGGFASGLPPVAVAVITDATSKSKVMFVSWRGSTTLMDWIMDGAFTPVSTSAWVKHSKGLKGHAGFCALVESDFVSAFDVGLMQLIKDEAPDEIIFTGHSLAGGMAQIAHMVTLSHLRTATQDASHLWAPVANMKSRAFSFAAPMVFSVLDDSTNDDLLKTFSDTSVNIVFNGDVVPRLPGDMPYLDKVVKNVASLGVGELLGLNSFMSAIAGAAVSKDSLMGYYTAFREKPLLTKVAMSYKHLAKIIFYEHSPEFKLKPTGRPWNPELLTDEQLREKVEETYPLTDREQVLVYLLQCHLFLPEIFANKQPIPRRDY